MLCYSTFPADLNQRYLLKGIYITRPSTWRVRQNRSSEPLSLSEEDCICGIIYIPTSCSRTFGSASSMRRWCTVRRAWCFGVFEEACSLNAFFNKQRIHWTAILSLNTSWCFIMNASVSSVAGLHLRRPSRLRLLLLPAHYRHRPRRIRRLQYRDRTQG